MRAHLYRWLFWGSHPTPVLLLPFLYPPRKTQSTSPTLMVDFLSLASGSPSKRSHSKEKDWISFPAPSFSAVPLAIGKFVSNRLLSNQTGPQHFLLQAVGYGTSMSLVAPLTLCTPLETVLSLKSLNLNLLEAIFFLSQDPNWEVDALLYHLNILHVFVISIQNENTKN